VRLLRSGVVVVAAGFLSLCAACEVFCQNSLRVPASVPTVPVVSLPGEDPFWRTVMIPARDHAHLEASFITPKEPTDKCVLMVHGIAANRSAMKGFVPLFTAHGYKVLMPDDRAHGNSGGSIITYGLLEKYDAIDWVHWMRSEGCEKIYGFGESLGASILIQAAAVEPAFRAIVAECAYSDLRAASEDRVRKMAGGLPAWLAGPLAKIMTESAILYTRVRFGADLSHISPVDDIAHTETPILLIHGLEDKRTPSWHSEVLAKANSRTGLWLVPGTGHSGASVTHRAEFNQRVMEWFARS
jgi:uncharacterized protein